jgi:hypothetical protein
MARPRKNGASTASMADEAAEAARLAAQEARDAQMEATKAIAIKTMTGDLRDRVLTILRYEQDKRPWSDRTEADQRTTSSQAHTPRSWRRGQTHSCSASPPRRPGSTRAG